MLSATEEAELDRGIAAAKSQRQAYAAEIAKQQAAIKAIKSQRSLEEVKQEITSARLANEAASDELAKLRREAGGAGPMSEKEEAQVRALLAGSIAMAHGVNLHLIASCIPTAHACQPECLYGVSTLAGEEGIYQDA